MHEPPITQERRPNIQTQPDIPAPLQDQQPKSNNKAIIFVGCILLLISSSIAVYFAYRNYQLNLQLSLNSSPKPFETPQPTITPSDIKWEEKEVSRTDHFKSFTISYPSDWTIGPGGQTILLEKEDSKIRIIQAPDIETSCLYPDDENLEGMFVKYQEYKEIQKGENILWRRAEPEDQPEGIITYRVCEKKDDDKYFQGLTSIGSIILEENDKDSKTLEEFDQILERIQIL